ncbi:hypothetical protein HOE31_00130 [bacterium]|jgi:hypothetical protein|nr:hypothetical protein [bacterium]MBT4121348.1 hypothetical protein [bacterium]MBT4335457.1 hypothetical protein [bacterium]MBT4495242.1 hypothetical protein [bacterium]MBT4763851.1 hypothetical protein [bacterium]
MNLYHNIRLIDELGIPHPKWEFVRSSKELKKFHTTKDYCGWTIRVAFFKDNDFRKPIYDNWVPKNKVLKKVDEFAELAQNDYFIVVYPSWKFNKSGTLLIDDDQYIIEAHAGSVQDLMRKGNVDTSLVFNREMKLIDDSIGNPDFLTKKEIKNILKATDIINKPTMLEWAIGQQNEFNFNKLEDLKVAGKMLVKKYEGTVR